MQTVRVPQRPYLLRALHEWMTDSGLTPQIIVDATQAGVDVPADYVRDSRIVLNISHAATGRLSLGNERIEFEARFGGTPLAVSVPLSAVLGIYARESNQGLVFAADEYEDIGEPALAPAGEEGGRPANRSHLKVIK